MGYDVPDQFPDIDTQEQTPAALPAVPVVVNGPVSVLQLPRRKGPILKNTLTTAGQHVLGPDPRRCRAVLICDVDWQYQHQIQGAGVPWYSKVPLVIEHGDAVYASVPTGTGTLTVICEYAGN
jgi:hypothetical protein